MAYCYKIEIQSKYSLMKKAFLLFLFVITNVVSFAQWNNWTDASSVKRNLLLAQSKGKTYFSQYHLYNVREKDIFSSKFKKQTGESLYIYGLDFYYSTGTYFRPSYKSKMRNNIIAVVKKQWRERRAIPSFSWHLENPYVTSDFGVSMGCRFHTKRKGINYPKKHVYVINEILNNKGERCGMGRYKDDHTNNVSYPNPRKWFIDQCKEVASIINEFVDDNGKPIPIIFRLWHECENSWQWWGSGMVSVSDYKKFFIYTEKLIKKYAPKSQIVWAYCPNRDWNTEQEFMLRYPGDDYVDIIGYDDYKLSDPYKFAKSREKARIVSSVAERHKKIAGIFETANTCKKTNNVFFKNYLSKILLDKQVRLGIVQIWGVGEFNQQSQYEDRKQFLNQPYIIK